MDKIELKWAKNEHDTNKTERKYIDFIISGKSLKNLLKIEKLDIIGTLGWLNQKIDLQRLQEIETGQSNLKSGRVILYGCTECGDISCGAITAEIREDKDSFVWGNFGYENGYEEIDYDNFKNIGPYIFDKNEYLNIFKNYRNKNGI